MTATSPLWAGEETLVPNALRGYRAWSVRDQQLTSTGVRHKWETPEVTARCISDGAAGSDPDCPCDLCARRLHASPVRECSCGIYGWYRPEDSRLVESDVFGVVEATGRVVLASHGFRAEKARVVALAIEPLRHSRRSGLRLYEAPSPTDLHEIAKWAKEQGVPVFPTRAELLDAYPPQDMTGLVGHECSERCQAHPEYESDDFSTAMRRLNMSFPTSATITYNTSHISPWFTLGADEEEDKPAPTPERCRHRWHTALLLWAVLGLGLSLYGLITDGLTALNAAGIAVNGGLGGYWLRHHTRRHGWRRSAR